MLRMCWIWLASNSLSYHSVASFEIFPVTKFSQLASLSLMVTCCSDDRVQYGITNTHWCLGLTTFCIESHAWCKLTNVLAVCIFMILSTALVSVWHMHKNFEVPYMEVYMFKKLYYKHIPLHMHPQCNWNSCIIYLLNCSNCLLCCGAIFSLSDFMFYFSELNSHRIDM